MGYLLKALRFVLILVFFFTDVCARACISQSSTHYFQLFRQLVASESAFLYDVAAALFPKPIDLPLSKALNSLVPITCTTYCFQG